MPVEEFLKIIYTIMCEGTIIFFSEYLIKSSSAVLAMKAIVDPFQICHSIIPVLPQALIHFIEAPVPVLIGLTKHQLRENDIEITNDTAINWIDLDNF